jgi:tetratricopeptide (TPR) repeat protein
MRLIKVLPAAAILFAASAHAQTLKDAIKLTENEQYDKASGIYKKLITSDPSNGDNYFYYGDNYYRNDMPDSAAILFKKGSEMNATNPLNYIGTGKIQWDRNDQTGAKASFYKATTLANNKNAVVFVKIAEGYINATSKNLDEAFKLLNQAMKIDPKNVDAQLLMGDAYLEKNDGSNAVKYYNKAIELDKSSAKGYVRIGKLWVRAKNYKEALASFAKAMEMEPNFAPAYRERAELYFKSGKYSEAVADYEKYLQLNPELSARIRYAQFLFLAKQYTKSIDEIKNVQKIDSSNVALYRIMGYNMYETKDFAGGMRYMNTFFDKATKKGSKILPSDYEYLGKLQAESGQDSIGVLTMTKAIEMDTARCDLYGDIGEILMKKKKYKDAAMYIEKKVACGKDVNINDYNRLGKAYYLTKEYVKADSAFVQVVKMQPTLPIGYFWRARTNASLDPDSKQGLAKPYYEQYITIAQKDIEKNKKDLVEAYGYLGFYYLQGKDYNCSKSAWLKVKELDPNNDKAKAALDDANFKKAAGDCVLIKQ